MEDNKTRVLYDRLTQDGYDIGDFDSFSKNVQDEAKRKSLYETITNDGYDVGDFDSFSSKLVARSQEEPVTNVRTQNVQPEQPQVQPVQDMPSYDPKTQGYILENVPDMFRSKGNNLATRPLPQQDLFENNPSDLVRKIGIDQQQRVEQAQKSANDPYMKEQNLELFKRQNQEQINSVNELINAARQERAKERQQRVRSVGDGGIFSTMSQAYLAGEQNDTDKQLEYASTLMEQAQNITNEAKKKGNTNFFAGFARGFKDAPLDGWAMGLQDLKNYSAVKKVMDKVDKGEELTPSEDALMQALVTNAATQMYYAGDLGRGYKAGGVTAESLPFMLDMIAGMGAVQALTKPASKAIVKYAADKAAQMGLGRATTGLAKGAARTVAGLGDVAAHTATFGSARVAADYQRRGLGDVQVKPNADGTVSYDGRENVQTGAEALGKSIISTAAETGSELLGEYFAPMLGYIGRVTGANKVGKIIPASVGKAFKDVVNSQGFREMQEIARRAKISDPFGEYAEEVANNLVSTAIGDMTPEQLVDLDQNIDTFLGVAPMSALFGAAGTGGYLRDQYKNYRNMRNFETQMQDAMGEDWSAVREALQDADIETARNMVKDVLSSPMSPDMKKNAIKYISSVLQEQTLQEADKQMMPEEIALEKGNIIHNLNKTRSKISLNDEELNAIINSEEGYQAIISQFDPETANNIMEYKQAYDDFVNYNYWVQDQADNARRQAEAQVESLTNATTGTIMRVNSRLSTNPVNILRGNLVFDNEGKVDENQSDKTIYYMSEDGRVKMAPVSMFSSLVDNTPAEDMIQRAGNDAQEEVLQAEEAQINSIPAQEQQPIGPETRFTMGGNNYEVNRVTPDGYEVYLLDENGTPSQSQLMSEEEIRNAINGQQPANAEETQPSVTEQTVQEETSEQPVQENQTAMSRIPLNERGEQDFEAAPVADTSAALLEISDNVDDAKDTATQMIDHYNNELKKAEKAKSTGNTIQEIVKMKQEKKANIKAINDKISYWNQVAADLEAKRPTGLIAQAEEKAKENQQRLASMTAEEQQAAQQEVQKKIDAGAFERKEPRKKVRYVKEDADLGPSITPQEHVLREIATGRVSFSLSDTEGAQGLSSHLGYSSSPEERKKLVWALSSDGLTPEAAAEQIHADMPENLQGMVTDQDVFNMIINAFQEYGSPSKMWDAAKNMHGTDIEENIPGYEEDQERQLIEWEASENRMSVPEWIAYLDYIEEELNNLYSSVTDEELNTIFERFYQQIEFENESRGNETESAGSTEGQTDGEQGDGLLPEGRGNNEGADTTVNEQPEPANQADGESGGVVPEPGSEVTREKETYDGALNNGNDSVSSQNNLNGKEHEQGEVAGVSGESGSLDGKNEAEAYLRRAGDRTTAKDGQSRWTRNTLLRDVVQRNKGHQTWIDDIQSIISGERIGLGGENDVYLSRDGKSVVKINDFSYLPENSTNFDSFMNRVDAHNELFPNDAITILGFTLNSDGKVSVVLSQSYISNAREATQEEIDNFLEEMGFYTDMSGNWTDGTYEIADTKPNNVLVDEDGNLHFIDVLPYDSRKPGKMLEIPAKRNAFVAPDIKKGEDVLDYIHRVAKAKEIHDAERETDTNPTEAQKEAGNYKKGHVKIDGYDVTIENPKGSVRSGKDADGNEWSVTMNNDYGYIRGTEGVDGDHIDVFLSDNPETGDVFVIDQVNPDGTFDEHKVMYGFKSALAAKRAYMANYSKGWTGLGNITRVSKEEFKKWVNSSHRKTKPFAEYKSVVPVSEKGTTTNAEDTPAKSNNIVSDERYQELKNRLKQKLGQLNAGIDPEIIAIGAEMAVYHIERGAVKFADYVKAMVSDLGDVIRPYLKAFYNAVRDMPQAEENGLVENMTPYEEVRSFDVTNFDKKTPDVMQQIQNVAKEKEIEKVAEESRKKPNDVKIQEVDIEGLFESLKKDGEARLSDHVKKPESELSGDSAQYQKKALQESEAVREIGVSIREKALIDVDGLDSSPLTMKDVKNILKKYSMLSDMSATDIQELVELAMTNETRKVALRYINSDKKKFGYDLILAMYNMQPLLNARDSTRFERQQYSTPTPFGYVMGQFVKDGKMIESVLEPSAGNGALTIAFPANTVHVNDIDERRLENLRTLGYAQVTNQDALIPFEGSVDAVLTNPPFGSTTAKEFDDGQIKISSLEGLMAINALESMKDNGRAAIVIGGNTSYRDNGAMQSKDMKLFAYLYSHYNVVDVINLNGDMYKRNGTKYDVRIILINGRKTGPFKLIAPPVKSKARAEQINSFEELYNRVQDDIRSLQQMGDLFNGTEGETRTTDTEGSGTNNNVSNRPKSGERGQSVRPDKKVGSDNDMGSTGNTTVSGPEQAERSTAEENAGKLDNADRSDAGSFEPVQEKRGSDNGGSTGGSRNDGSVRSDSGDNTGRSRLSVNLSDEKVPYPNRSQSGTLMSVVPANQAQVLADSLANIGDVDQFLVDQLGYSSKDELFSYLAAEQIDSVSLAINQMNKGNGFIIGDMTGVGKGRQGAALIRYAVRKGYNPIYFTQKPALFSDNYRDLADIGSGDLRPFIIASDPKNAAITDASGNVVHKLPTDKEKKRVFDYIMKNGKLPEEYDYVITTYSQINNGTKEYEPKEDGIAEKDKSYKKKSPSAADKSGQERRDVIQALSKDNIMILDESHTAGGSGGGSMYMQYIMPKVKGVTFLSATFAKRADNMPIYAMKTDLSKSGISPQDMIEAISQGGVTLQEIMSKQLVQSGQMIRRERSFQGVTIDWMPVSEEEDAVQRKQFDEVSSIFSDIRAFQKDYITPIVEGISEELSEQGGYSDLQQGTAELGVTNTPFASKMYNLVNQLLFSLKADAVANRVIENLKNGFKPVISFTNTMEGFLDEAPKDTPMDKVPNFSATLMRALDGVMRYTETNLKGEKENKFFTVNDLPEAGQNKYYEIREKIENLSADLPISPMDAIKMKIQKAGYKVGEITGRTLEMVQDENGKYVIQNRKDRDKKSAARDFNNGQLDVLMVNKSGSTGISLHASPKFEDQRQRVMVFAQFQSDINDEVQMRGRIDRTGQKFRGKYEYIMSSIPAEQRLQMMFKAKLKSLDANTTSSQKSKFNEMEVVDYLNKYGDDVTWQYMLEHPELSEKLGDPLKILTSEGEESQSGDTNTAGKEGCAAKIARYLPFLPVKEQEEVFKDITDAYNVKIQLLNDAGENDLEITTMPLKAKTISKKIWKPGTDPNSGNAFADNTYLEEVEVDVLKKPMKAEEIKSTVSRMTSGEPFNEWLDNRVKEINSLYDGKIATLKERLDQSALERSEKAKKNYIEKSKEARKNGKNEFTDEEIEKMSEVVVEDIMKKSKESFIKQKNVIEARRENILKQINSFTPMKPLVIPFNLDETLVTIMPSRGMFLGYKFSKDYSPSSSTAIFATLDGRRKVEIPLNQEKAFNSIRMNTMMQPTYLKDLNVDTWDSYVPTQTRKKVYIVTGNLLQALVDTKKSENVKGYLVSYSTIEGDTKQGILMSDNFKPENLTTSAPISSRLIQIQQGETVISEDKRVIVEKNTGWRSGYALKVPKSKKQGGEFFEDNKLRSLADNKEFTTRGNYMVADISSDNLSKVLDRLSKMGVTVSKKAKLENSEDVRFREDYDTTFFRDVTDLDEIDRLEREPKIKVYRAMQVINGKLYPPMMAAINGQLVSPRELGTWEVADERPEAIKYTKKNKEGEDIGYVDLDKATKDATGKKATKVSNVAYNPYWHTSHTMLNDQFTSAWIRPNLVTVEVEVPLSELTSGYRAEYAKNSVGEVEWKSGPVSSQLAKLGKPRRVVLSRWDKPIRVVPESEVAQHIKDLLGDSGIEIPENVVTPKLKQELEKIGVKIGNPQKGIKKTEQIEDALQAGLMVDNSLISEKDQLLRYIEGEGKEVFNSDVRNTSQKLGLPVEIIHSIDEIPEGSAKEAIKKGRKVKGWYSLSDNKVYVYLPNATSMEDVYQTILHEGVAHYGLRQLVGEDRMDDFLDDVFANVTDEVRKKIIDTLPRYGYNSRIATEEYMARMAENGVDVSVWQRIKQAFNSLMRRMGINIKISDNELRYILWRSRQNLDKNKPLDLAKDVAMQYQMGAGNYFREDTDGSIGMYEQSLKGWKYKAQEAYQDSMLALKNLQEVIAKVSGKPIKSFENAYMAENQLSSKNTSEAEVYYKKHYQPMLQEAGKIMKKYGLTQKGIERYMMLAHGIERNVELTFREQLDEVIKNNPDDADQFIQDFKDEKERLRKLYSGYEYLKELSDYIGGVNDYSATQAILNSMDGEEHDNFQEDALNYVKDFEQTYDVKELWNKTNDATKTTLRKGYDSGMMGKEQYSNVNNMYMYYVPLRGWDEQTAEDVYEYIDSERNPVSSVLKSAKGRKSIPDEIFATIGNMAESAIMQGNRNMMKQNFMSMVINHPTDIATLKKAWYVYDPVKDEWNISMPDIQESDNAETIAEKIKNHEERMKQLKENGLATQKPNGLNINYRINKNNISQHVVQVKNGGKDYVIYINGNPRAAQAINGLTNPNVEQNPIFRSIATANRWLAANFTTRNPAFVLSNLVRDLIFSNVAVSIKEDGKYSSRFRKNILKAMPVVLRNLNGKPNNNEADRYFKEFIENGGETGYMHLNDVEKYKKKVRKELSKINGEMGSAKMAMDFAIDRLEDFNRWAEDTSRFTTYMTSRQMGRSITESVNDAKEVTVNFNKKGAGYKTGGFFGMTSGIFRNLYLFFNASVQSLTNFKRLYDKQPVKFYSALGGFMSAGFLMPMINNVLYSIFGGGDDDPYNDLPEWVRRNNLCIYTGNDTFLTIPLPIELRAFYGLGDYAYQLTTGKEKPSATNIAKGTVGQLADLLPLNPTGNEGLKTFMPDIMSPIFEAYVWNKDFTGKPVAKISPFNERDPEWKRVYKGTSGWLVDTSKFLNDISNGSGPGSEFRKGFIDFNPAKVEHLLESYFGGMAKTFNQAGKTIYYGGKSLIEQQKDEDLVMRNVPIVNRFLNTVDERNAFSGINTEYFNLRDEMDQFKYELNGVKKSGNKDEYKEMLNSDLYDKYQKYKPYQKKLKKLNDMAKESQGEDRKEIEDMIIETRRELLEEVK